MDAVRRLRGRPPDRPAPAAALEAPPNRKTTSVDVENCYLVFLGRPVESVQALTAGLALPIDRLKLQFATSTEFATVVASPVLASSCVDDARFAQPVESRLILWALESLNLTDEARRTVEAAVTWPALMTGLIEDFQAQGSNIAPPIDWSPNALLVALAARERELNASLADVGGANGVSLKLMDAVWIAPGLILIHGRLRSHDVSPSLEAVLDGRAFRAELLMMASDLRESESRFRCLVEVDVESGWSGPAKVGLRLCQAGRPSGVTAWVPLARSKGLGSPKELLDSLVPTLSQATEPSLSLSARAAGRGLAELRKHALQTVPLAFRDTPDVSIVIAVGSGAHRLRHLLCFIDLWARGLEYEVVLAPISPDVEATTNAAIGLVKSRGVIRILSTATDLPVGVAAEVGLIAAAAFTVLLMSDGYIPPRAPCLRAVVEEAARSSSVIAIRSAANFDGMRHSVKNAIASIYWMTNGRVDLRQLDRFQMLANDLGPGVLAGSRRTLLDVVARVPTLFSSELFWLSLLAFSDQLTTSAALESFEFTYIGFQAEPTGAYNLDLLILQQDSPGGTRFSEHNKIEVGV